MRCNVFTLQGWADMAGDSHVLGKDILHPIRTEMPTSSIGEQCLAVASGRRLQPGL
jgi:hypothetical protein